MKILEINKFYNDKRGADKHFLDVIRLLKRNGHTVAEFSMHQPDNMHSDWSNYFLSPVGYGKQFSLWQQLKGVGRMFYSPEAHRKIRTLLSDFEPDVVHIHNIYHQMDPTILFEIKKRGIPIVMTVHDFKLINPNHAMMLSGKPYERCKNHAYYQCFLDRAVKGSYAKSFIAMLEMYWHYWLGTFEKNVDAYIAPSIFVKDRLAAWGIPAEKIVTQAHFIPMQSNTEEASAQEADIVLSMGGVSTEKGTDLLVEICRNIKAARLYIAGSLQEPRLLLETDATYLGQLNKQQLQGFLKRAICTVSGSQLPETFGLVALESIALGVPFVAFDTGAYSEIIRHGKNGFLAKTKEEFAKYLQEVIENPAQFDRKAIADDARERFGEAAYHEALMTVFQKAKSGLTKG